MTTSITAKTCEAWFLLEAADLRGLPAPFAVRAYVFDGPVEVQVHDAEAVETWAKALDSVVDQSVDSAGYTHWTADGVLHDMAVKVTAAARIPAVQS